MFMNGGSNMYGKGDVFVYRTYASPLRGVKPIPESDYEGDDNVIFAWNVDVALGGESFRASFTEGDNAWVVATDSMKNFILRHAADFEGSTIESFLYEMASRFLARYGHVEFVELGAERVPFDTVPVGASGGIHPSHVVFRHSRGERTTARVRVARDGAARVEVTSLEGGLAGVQLIKVRGSSFAGFIRDEYTTLPETSDRPLFIYLNLAWTYSDSESAIGSDLSSYAPAEQIGGIVQTVFHEVHSPSIQHLLHLIGLRILERFPQLATVSFESNNRTWETIVEHAASGGAVYTEPRPPFGFQRYTLTRSDADEQRTNNDARFGSAAGQAG